MTLLASSKLPCLVPSARNARRCRSVFSVLCLRVGEKNKVLDCEVFLAEPAFVQSVCGVCGLTASSFLLSHTGVSPWSRSVVSEHRVLRLPGVCDVATPAAVGKLCSCIYLQWTVSLCRVFQWCGVRLVATFSARDLRTVSGLRAQHLSDFPFGDDVVITFVFTVCWLHRVMTM